MKMQLTTKIGSLIALLGVLLIAGCAGRADGPGNDKNSGFYGGVTGGGSP
ncbi:MAG TPA: hypothetical protein VGM07_06760 [Stellaceae bacterium]|jgi:hypothetical protein